MGAHRLIFQAILIFRNQPCFLSLVPPLVVCGDIHGQFTDLLRVFRSLGRPPKKNYLFLGDYVDRGPQSLETLQLLLLFKCRFPKNFFMLRGNHETAAICRVYGFYDECIQRYGKKRGKRLWQSYTQLFDWLPYCCLIDGKIFCVHAGLSPDLISLKHDLNGVQRPTAIPDYGLLCDLVWSDPSTNLKNIGWGMNDRGVSFIFGQSVIDEFCQANEIDLIVRGHQVVQEGFEFFNSQKNFLTIFTAPNYCGEFGNLGAVMEVDQDLCCVFRAFEA